MKLKVFQFLHDIENKYFGKYPHRIPQKASNFKMSLYCITVGKRVKIDKILLFFLKNLVILEWEKSW